jgi:hypothetical protein
MINATKLKMLLARLDKKRSPVTAETRESLSNLLKGRKDSYIVLADTRKKLSETMKQKGRNGCLVTDKLQ